LHPLQPSLAAGKPTFFLQIVLFEDSQAPTPFPPPLLGRNRTSEMVNKDNFSAGLFPFSDSALFSIFSPALPQMTLSRGTSFPRCSAAKAAFLSSF